MKSVIAILTFRRKPVIEKFLSSIIEQKLHVKYPVAVFEDCGNFDDTVGYLTNNAEFAGTDNELDAEKYVIKEGEGQIEVYVGRKRSGVACSSNKALKWFERLDADHILLCNDDLVATGDFVAEYQEGIVKLGFEFMTFNDFEDEVHKATVVRYKMREVRIMVRMVGIMTSITKRVVKTIGYFDERFPFFGEEHCEYNNRARLAGFLNLNGQAQLGLDIVSKHLAHQEVASSVLPFEKRNLDPIASQAINRISMEYYNRHLYRPYRLRHSEVVDGWQGQGIPSAHLDILNYALVFEHPQEEESW